jgi:heat shock protein HslJ
LLTFEDTGEIEGFGGCNEFTAKYEVEPAGTNQGGIEFEMGTTTNLACVPEVLAQEELVFQLLEDKVTAYSYDPKEKILTLLDKNGKDIFEAELEE